MTTSECILVIEDDEGIRTMVGLALRRDGYVVEEATGLAEASEVLARVRPGLVLLDVLLKTGDGRLDVSGLRKRLGVPIVLMTASQDAERLAREAGADAALQKPFDLAQLRALVRRLLHEDGQPPNPDP